MVLYYYNITKDVENGLSLTYEKTIGAFAILNGRAIAVIEYLFWHAFNAV